MPSPTRRMISSTSTKRASSPIWEINDDLPEHLERFRKSGKVDHGLVDEHEEALRDLVALLPGKSFRGSMDEQVMVRTTGSWLINDLVSRLVLSKDADSVPHLELPEEAEVRMRFLQNLVWHYVISSETLASQQVGQVRIVGDLFRIYLRSARGALPHGLSGIPPAYELTLKRTKERTGDDIGPLARLAADIVAGLPEEHARRLHRRFRGMAMGSVTDTLTH